MRTAMTTARVYQLHGGAPVDQSVLAISFGLGQAPLAPADQERELRIQAEGFLVQAEMLAWERTGDFGAHGAATRHLAAMQQLIADRPAHVRARMALERGLPHA